MKFKILTHGLLIVGLAGPLVAGAADLIMPTLHPHSEGSITYVSGGFGIDERQAMDAVAKDYNLKLIFAEKGSGAYLADAKVSIVGMKGQKILDAVSNGPWFMARLPAGHYTITAAIEGKSLVRKATVTGGRHSQVRFYWPAAAVGN
jgi:hypothetical protein